MTTDNNDPRVNLADTSRETGRPAGVTISVCGIEGRLSDKDIELLRRSAWDLNDERYTPEQKDAMERGQEALRRLRERVAARKAGGTR